MDTHLGTRDSEAGDEGFGEVYVDAISVVAGREGSHVIAQTFTAIPELNVVALQGCIGDRIADETGLVATASGVAEELGSTVRSVGVSTERVRLDTDTRVGNLREAHVAIDRAGERVVVQVLHQNTD